jgi:hypothetical protein
MPVHNGRADHVRQAIDSVLAQERIDLELILVDDGSKNDVVQILRDTADREPRVCLLRLDENQGVVAARNRGVAIARAAYIGCLDSDDIALPGRFRQQADMLDARPSLSVCFGGALEMGFEGEDLQRYRGVSQDSEVLKAELLFNSRLCHSTMLCRKTALLEAGGYREGFDAADDYSLYVELAKTGAEFAGIDEPLVRYRISPDGITQSRRGEQLRLAEELSYEYAQTLLGLALPRSAYTELWHHIATQGHTRLSFSSVMRLLALFAFIDEHRQYEVWIKEGKWITRAALGYHHSLSALLCHLFYRYRLPRRALERLGAAPRQIIRS